MSMKLPHPDSMDPRYWDSDRGPYALIPLSDRDGSLCAKVDWEDYEWAIAHKWGFCLSQIRKTGGLEKFYARRSVRLPSGRAKEYLHKAVLLRAVGPHPEPEYTIGDHRNGDSLDCRRANLRWATPSMNRINLNGRYPTDFFE